MWIFSYKLLQLFSFSHHLFFFYSCNRLQENLIFFYKQYINNFSYNKIIYVFSPFVKKCEFLQTVTHHYFIFKIVDKFLQTVTSQFFNIFCFLLTNLLPNYIFILIFLLENYLFCSAVW